MEISEEYTTYIGSEVAIEHAKECNLDIVIAGPQDIQLDIDDTAALARYENIIGWAFQFYPMKEIKRTISKSGKNTHIYLRLDNPTPALERIFVQAILGSDPKREMLSSARLSMGDPHPVLFYEIKETAVCLKK